MATQLAMLRKPSEEASVSLASQLKGASLELGAQRASDIPALADILPAGTPVFVPHLPRHDLETAVQCSVALRNAGLEPVPHIAVRRMTSAAETEGFLAKLTSLAGVRRLLLIGSDLAPPAGHFREVADLLHSKLLSRTGIEHVEFGGYPDGHPQIDQAALWNSLEQKIALASDEGCRSGIVTQFSFSATAVADYVVELNGRFPGVPVRVGMAGPCNPLTLMKFAQACGVVASIRAASGLGIAAARLALNGNPSTLASNIATLLETSGPHSVAGLHLFSFGGTRATAEWMKRSAQ